MLLWVGLCIDVVWFRCFGSGSFNVLLARVCVFVWYLCFACGLCLSTCSGVGGLLVASLGHGVGSFGL